MACGNELSPSSRYPRMTDTPLSILDLAQVLAGEAVADGLAATVSLAQRAEGWGYRRIWYAEHHNMPTIASSATAVLIAHVAAHTSTIRLGSGGVMLPNHAPLVIAEQFGTLAELHPGRIDLGLGRAPGTDQVTVRALRRDSAAADTFPRDVQELQGFLSESLVPGVSATPGAGTRVPLYILGSSMFGAQLAAALGLPYAFASHFAPDALEAAVATYRRDFRPSDQLAKPYVIAGAGVIAADTETEARRLFELTRRARVRMFLGRGRTLSDQDVEQLIEGPGGAQVDHMLRYTGVGSAEQVKAWLSGFATHADADELILVSSAIDRAASQHALELLAPNG